MDVRCPHCSCGIDSAALFEMFQFNGDIIDTTCRVCDTQIIIRRYVSYSVSRREERQASPQPYQEISLSTLKDLLHDAMRSDSDDLIKFAHDWQAIQGASSVQQIVTHMISLGVVTSIQEAKEWLNELVIRWKANAPF